jgi:hypothetical protein
MTLWWTCVGCFYTALDAVGAWLQRQPSGWAMKLYCLYARRRLREMKADAAELGRLIALARKEGERP